MCIGEITGKGTSVPHLRAFSRHVPFFRHVMRSAVGVQALLVDVVV